MRRFAACGVVAVTLAAAIYVHRRTHLAPVGGLVAAIVLIVLGRRRHVAGPA